MYINEDMHHKFSYLTSSLFVAIHQHGELTWEENRKVMLYLLENAWAVVTKYENDFDGFATCMIAYAPSLEDKPYTKIYDMFTDIMEAYERFFK